jgi:hypothetical protein
MGSSRYSVFKRADLASKASRRIWWGISHSA